MKKTRVIHLDGKPVAFEPGETVLEVAQREGIYIPTLCHDPRLDPAGACRTCLVEVEGSRRLVPACAYKRGNPPESAHPRLQPRVTYLPGLAPGRGDLVTPGKRALYT